jgi:hypothetical protein
MPRLAPEHISEFVRAVMPSNSTDEQLRHAQGRLDDYLDVIDAIHTRLMREDLIGATRDKAEAHDMLDSHRSES